MSRFRFGRRPAVFRRKLLLEGLDRRVLLAGLMTEVIDGVATISGTPANDEIAIAPMTQRGEVHVFEGEECVSAWPRSDVREIDVQSFAGDDLIRVGDSVTAPVKVTGGSGLDTVLINDPHAHRHGWAFDVEQVMAEGEFSSIPMAGQGDHAGHGMTDASVGLMLSPIPADHVHISAQSAIPPLDMPDVSQPDASAEMPTMTDHSGMVGTSTSHITTSSSATPNSSVEMTSSDPMTADAQQTSPLQHSVTTDAMGMSESVGSTTSSVLAVTTSASNLGQTEHAGHDSMIVSIGSAVTSSHAEHSSATSTIDSSHAGHGQSTIGGEGSSHAGHGSSMTGADGSSHAGHSQSVTSLDHSSHAGHFDSTTATQGTSHAGHGQHAAFALGMAYADGGLDATFTMVSAHADHGHASSTSHSAHAGHAQHESSSNHASPAGHDHHSATHADRAHGDAPSGACHANPKLQDTEAVAEAPSEQQVHSAAHVVEERVPVSDRSTAMLPGLARLLAIAGAGALLYHYAVRRWRLSNQPASQDEGMPRLGFEWIAGYGVPNS